MKNHINLLLIIFALSFFPAISKSQNAFLSAGNDISGNGGSISYSIGQVAFSEISGLNGNIIEGVQQPYEISVLTGKDDLNNITLSSSVFPNPVTSILYLKSDSYSNQKMYYQLLNINGITLKEDKIDNMVISIPVFDLASSTYFLKVYIGHSNVKTFKIIKH